MARRRRSSLRARAVSLAHTPLATIHQGLLQDNTVDKQSSSGSDNLVKSQRSNVVPSHATLYTKDKKVERASNPAGACARTVPPLVQTSSATNLTPVRCLRGTSNLVDSCDIDAAAEYIQSPEICHHKANALPQGLAYSDSYTDESRWRSFISATSYPANSTSSTIVVDEFWLKENGADYNRPWLADQDALSINIGRPGYLSSRNRYTGWRTRFQRTVFRSPLVPLMIRLIVMGFSIIALALAASIHRITSTKANLLHKSPSTLMALIVDAVAVIYLSYIAYDEYSGKPLGLRATTAKLRLIFLDLIFIVFDSANLSIAFSSIGEIGCQSIALNSNDCATSDFILAREVALRQKSLASVLLIALVAWLLTFAISITRLVDKVTHH